ncbi:MAG: hypothetical protein HY000_19940 [Planctomycetes bacterium]|nr:hypothetical protein [Planctomycetota bacterium]
MASSDSQGLQIALIIFVILTIILSVTTFVFFRQSDQYFTQATTDRADAQKANTGLRTATDQINQLKQMAGFAEGDSMEAITKSFEEDKAKYMNGLPGDQTYRGAMQQLFASFQTASAGKAAADAKSAAMETEMRTNLASHQAQQKQFTDDLEALRKELEGERGKYTADRETLSAQNSDLLAQVQQKDDAVAAANTQREQNAQDLAAKLDIERTRYTGLRTVYDNVIREAPDRPDGEIVWTNQRAGTVWINRGSADFLRRQTSFSVFNTDVNKVVTTPSKARIEVTQVLGEHMAEAKIVDDDLSNPITQGDMIYSPVWDPGRPVQFAVIGRMDINGDHVDDRQLIENLITMSGGVIVAKDDDPEDRDITVETRYVVQGENPTEDTTRSDKFNRIFAAAKEVGAELISVGELLDRMGYKDINRVVQLGKFAKSSEMMNPTPDGGIPVSRGATSTLYDTPAARGSFRPRRPPQPKTQSAYDAGKSPSDAAPAAPDAAAPPADAAAPAAPATP